MDINIRSQKIGFIGQGWIGKHYADDFDNRGYTTVRYSLEEPYINNKDEIKDCEIVFIAVPTPTTPKGFSYELVADALSIVAPGATAVIKSTVLPNTTKSLQDRFPNVFVMHSPEFLREATAPHDAANPDRNIIGIPMINEDYKYRADQVLSVLPKANYQTIIPSLEAEMIKYIGNCFLYAKVLMMNTFHDMVTAAGGDWDTVREVVIQDPRIGESHTEPLHKSGHTDDPAEIGRGAGGHCFIKDFEAFKRFHQEHVDDDYANKMLQSMINYNNHLLLTTNKDLDILKAVYGIDLLNNISKE